jgi:hypothetical protein
MYLIDVRIGRDDLVIRNDIRPSLHDILEDVSSLGSLIYELHQIDKKVFTSDSMKPETTLRYNGAFSLLDIKLPSEAIKHISDYFDENPHDRLSSDEINLLLDVLRKAKLQFTDVTESPPYENRYNVLQRIYYISWEGDERVFGYQLYDTVGEMKVAVTVGRMIELAIAAGVSDVHVEKEEISGMFQVMVEKDIPRMEVRESDIRDIVREALFDKDTYYTFDITTLLRMGCLKRLYLSMK